MNFEKIIFRPYILLENIKLFIMELTNFQRNYNSRFIQNKIQSLICERNFWSSNFI